MKPAPFAYVAPDSLEGAIGQMVEHGFDAKLLAGGQSLIPLLNFRLAQPAVLVDLNRLTELSYLRTGDGGGLRIGALTRQSELEHSPEVAREAPLLHEAMPLVAHPQIRNRGTVGGSLAHADPSAELPVVAIALDAVIHVEGKNGRRAVAARDFYVGLLTTALEPEEILVEVEIPAQPPNTGSAFVENSRRLGDYAQAGAAAVLTLAPDGGCADARLVFLSAGDKPMVATEAAQLLIHEGLGDASLEAAARHAAANEIDPTSDIHASAAFKRHLAEVMAVRALRAARERALRKAGGSGS